jgi:hypothetical protein
MNMRKVVALLAFATVAAASQAIVLSVPCFATPVFLQEDFDSIPAGNYFAQAVFSAPAIGTVFMAPGGAGPLYIGPPPGFQPPALSPLNTCFGQSSGIALRVVPNMRRFCANFRNQPNSAGVAATMVKIAFYNGATLLGTQTFPLTNAWTQQAFMTVPQLFNRVEIYGNMPNGEGVEMDDMRVRPF